MIKENACERGMSQKKHRNFSGEKRKGTSLPFSYADQLSGSCNCQTLGGGSK